MGQALRRATGTLRTSSSKPPAQVKNVERQPRAVPPQSEISKNGENQTEFSDPDAFSRTKLEQNVLEERDPRYDAMLSQMVGRIKSKPGGRFEMGEAAVVERYTRPLPKLRDTKARASFDDPKVGPPGTLNVTQLREVFLLHQGKSEDHSKPMDAQSIAEKLRVDTEQVQRILKFLALPPEDDSSKSSMDSK